MQKVIALFKNTRWGGPAPGYHVTRRQRRKRGIVGSVIALAFITIMVGVTLSIVAGPTEPAAAAINPTHCTLPPGKYAGPAVCEDINTGYLVGCTVEPVTAGDEPDGVVRNCFGHHEKRGLAEYLGPDVCTKPVTDSEEIMVTCGLFTHQAVQCKYMPDDDSGGFYFDCVDPNFDSFKPPPYSEDINYYLNLCSPTVANKFDRPPDLHDPGYTMYYQTRFCVDPSGIFRKCERKSEGDVPSGREFTCSHPSLLSKHTLMDGGGNCKDNNPHTEVIDPLTVYCDFGPAGRAVCFDEEKVFGSRPYFSVCRAVANDGTPLTSDENYYRFLGGTDSNATITDPECKSVVGIDPGNQSLDYSEPTAKESEFMNLFIQFLIQLGLPSLFNKGGTFTLPVEYSAVSPAWPASGTSNALIGQPNVAAAQPFASFSKGFCLGVSGTAMSLVSGFLGNMYIASTIPRESTANGVRFVGATALISLVILSWSSYFRARDVGNRFRAVGQASLLAAADLKRVLLAAITNAVEDVRGYAQNLFNDAQSGLQGLETRVDNHDERIEQLRQSIENLQQYSRPVREEAFVALGDQLMTADEESALEEVWIARQQDYGE